jgi:hypothetical protein
MTSIQTIIRAMMFTPGMNNAWGIPVLFESEPGEGKTSIVMDLQKDGLLVLVVLGSVRDPSDIGGLPIEIDGVVHRCPDAWVAKCMAAKRVVVFFDEFNTAAPATMNAILRVINERAVGDDVLPPTVRFIAAQNPVEQTAQGYDLAPPMANRFLHLDWQAPSTPDWTCWLMGMDDSNFGEAKAAVKVETKVAERIEAEVLAAWPEALSQASALVASFITKRPELLHKMPKIDDPRSSKAWPSRRTWEMATRVLAGASIHGLDESTTNMLLSGCVGTDAIAEFATWRAEQDLPDAAEVLDGKVSFGHDPKRLDRTAAVLNACASLVADKGCTNRKARAAMMWRMLGALIDHAADLTVTPAKVMVKAGLMTLPEARPVLAKLDPMLKAAGLR